MEFKRKIIITEEERVKYAEVAQELQRRALFKNRKSKSKICPVCRKDYQSKDARVGNHVGYCSLECSGGQGKSCVRKKDKKKKTRQLNRQKNINAVLSKDFYLCQGWREVRYKALRKFGFKCLACGRKPPSVVLHVDHIKPRSKFPELELSLENLQILCEDCNMGKLNHFDDDLRPK